MPESWSQIEVEKCLVCYFLVCLNCEEGEWKEHNDKAFKISVEGGGGGGGGGRGVELSQ